jgi:hypothetical protein
MYVFLYYSVISIDLSTSCHLLLLLSTCTAEYWSYLYLLKIFGLVLPYLFFQSVCEVSIYNITILQNRVVIFLGLC